MDATYSSFNQTMFAPCGWSVVATYPDGRSKTIAMLDDRQHAIDYAYGSDANNFKEDGDLLSQTVYTVKQNYPTSAYTNWSLH